MEEKNSEKKERKMRDSGIPWIGEVPEKWKVMKIGHCFRLKNEKNFLPENKVQLLSLYTGIGVFPTNSEKAKTSGNHAQTVNGYKIVHKNDIVVNIILAWMGSIGVSDYDGVVSPAYDVYTPDLSKVIPRYAHYVFRTDGIAGECLKYGRGIMMIRLRTYSPEFKQIKIPFPSLKEQHRIADFLDSKCSEIDALIENLRARVESAKEYKKAVITEAVTKGLDKDAKMKDSGVEWIGEVPEGWKICKVKQISNKITDGAHISPDTTNGEFKFLSVTNMNDTGALDFVNCLKINSVQYAYLVKTGCQPKKDDVLISKDGTIGKTTVVSDNNFVVASSLVIIRPNQLKIRPKYLKYCLMSNIVQEQLLSVLAGSALKRVSIEKNANLKFVYTYDMTTQQQIIDYLDSKCSEIDTLLQNYEDQIATLEEYKKSLIYEYVTGKKEVPEA